MNIPPILVEFWEAVRMIAEKLAQKIIPILAFLWSLIASIFSWIVEIVKDIAQKL